MKNRRLREDAIPTIFDGLPSYFSSSPAPPRTSKSSAEKRRQRDEDRLDTNIADFFDAEKVTTLAEIKEKLDRSLLPSSFTEANSTDDLVFVEFLFSEANPPRLKSSLVIKDDLSFKLFAHDSEISKNLVLHIAPSASIRTTSDVLNILAFLAGYDGVCEKVIDQIKVLLEKLGDVGDNLEEEKVRRKFDFLYEQLSILFQESKRHRYSPDLMATAVLWHNISPSLYKQILADDLITFPSIR